MTLKEMVTLNKAKSSNLENEKIVGMALMRMITCREKDDDYKRYYVLSIIRKIFLMISILEGGDEFI